MIKPGDMVMVTWACCAMQRRYGIGNCGTVSVITHALAKCEVCGWEGTCSMADFDDGRGTASVPLSWLIKLDPPGVETEKREEVEA